MKEKEHFVVCKTFLNYNCLVDHVVSFLELSMFTNASLPTILFDKMDRGFKHKKTIFC